MKYFLILIIFSAAVIFVSCKRHDKTPGITVSKETMIDTAAGSCPFLTKDAQNNVVVSWVKQVDSSHSIYCYAISKDEGKTFSSRMEIPSSANIHAHAENLPKIVFKPSGEIIAIWGASNPNPNNAYSGLVFYTQSFDEGKTWSKAKQLVTDTAGYDQRYFDVALMPDGEAAVIWLDNRKKTDKEGSALYMAKTNGNDGFKNEHLISEPCCQCCRTDLFIDSKKDVHVLYRAIVNDSIRDMVHAVSTDGGNTFTEPKKISNDNWVVNGCPHTGPAMAENNEGLQFAWFTAGTGTGVFYNHSKDNGKTFSDKDSLSSRTGKHPQIATLANGNVIIVWDENLQKDNKFVSRIGFQQRVPGGDKHIGDYITSDSISSTFPVINPINDEQCIVAYTESKNSRSHVFYKLVSVR